MSDNLKIEVHGHTAVVTFQNPPAHTWTPASLLELSQIIGQLNADRNNYALILTGDGDKFFSAGADLNLLNHNDKAKAFEFAQAFGHSFEALANYTGVSIAAINGYAMGGGLEVALACDIRIADHSAKMALPECAVGLIPAGLGTQLLPWLVGEQWAKRMILLGERLSADQALTIGLVSELVSYGQVLERAFKLANMAVKQSPTSVRYSKALIMAARQQPMSSFFTAEREDFVSLWDSEDQAEGVAAFIEKRIPKWKNC